MDVQDREKGGGQGLLESASSLEGASFIQLIFVDPSWALC